jgi:hypothetical protein
VPQDLCVGNHRASEVISLLQREVFVKQADLHLDDVIIWSRTFDEHLEHLTEVFERIRAFLKASKCTFARSDVDLGHLLTREGIKPLNKNV